jgi:hypothetical protein
MRHVVLLIALLASPAAAQHVAVDSTYDVYSKVSRVRVMSERLATDLPGLSVYAVADVVIAPSHESYAPYTTVCRVWAGLIQDEPGRYWRQPGMRVDLLVRKGPIAAGGRSRGSAITTVAVSHGRTPGDVRLRLTPERRTAAGVTAQFHGDGAGPFILEFPAGFFDAAAAVVARADSALVRASLANHARESCR